MLKRMLPIAGVGLCALAFVGAAQSVAPEVLLYAHIRTRAQDQQTHLPDYTCLETISRFHRGSPHGSLQTLDTVRLEVIYSDHHEWFGSPGGRAMDSSDPSKFVGSGLMASGVFATGLDNILYNAQVVYRGEETFRGSTAVRYDVTFSPRPPAFGITMPGGSGNVGEKGSLLANRDSLDLLRLELHATDIPSYLPLAAQDTSVNYSPVRIGGSTALLPEDADMTLVQTNGVADFDHMDFAYCRAYETESTIRFDPEPAAGASPADVRAPTNTPEKPASLPALLKVTIALQTPVSDTDAVGSLIEGKVVGNVLWRRKIAIPNGAIVHGRIRRLEHSLETGKDFIIGLEFTELEGRGAPVRFYADLLSIQRSPLIRVSQTQRIPIGVNGMEKVTLPELPGVASFFVSGKTFRIPEGFQTVWRTRGPIRGIEKE